MKRILLVFIFLLTVYTLRSLAAKPPTQLTTDLLEHTDRIFLDGYPSSIRLEERNSAIERWQVAAIRSERPYFGWVMNGTEPGTLQTACRILVATDAKLLAQNQGDMWDSGRIPGDNSTAVQYAGKLLLPSTVYYWKVQTWDNHGGESAFSAPKAFLTAGVLDNRTATYPQQVTDEYPARIQQIQSDGTPAKVKEDAIRTFFIDFGKAAFGRLRITMTSAKADTVTVHMGEYAKDGRIDRKPGGTIRYAAYILPVMAGTHTYTVKIRPDRRNTSVSASGFGAQAILMPAYTGEVLPFRYCEIEARAHISKLHAVRQTVHYPFDGTASHFFSSDTVLNRVWEMSKYSIRATSFAGTYVDGDRERIPYEADAYINQMCHYGVDREYAIARHSHEWLIGHATWPSEWIMQSVLMAWNDYLYTGNAASLTRFYGDLKAKTLAALAETNGLISTRTGKQTPEFLQSIHFHGKEIRDIVDWPQKGGFGMDPSYPGEADLFDFTDYNTVVNAYHCEALRVMSHIAGVLGHFADRDAYAKQAEHAASQFNRLLLDRKRGYYRDGIDTEHSALHSNMFPLAFGLVPKWNVQAVTDFVRSRGMACSVYGSQFLMDAVYNGHDAAYGLALLTSTGDRSWYNMIRAGSTVSLEAWDNKFKPNQDWNHAWGAVPANAIPRKLMGVEPLEPGFRRIRIKPQPATLTYATATVPTVRGSVKVAFNNTPDTRFELDVEIPANTEAEIWLPLLHKKQCVTVNGATQKGVTDGDFVKLTAGSGKYRFVVEKQ